jgi:MYXO-CTERM domain-containing protein
MRSVRLGLLLLPWVGTLPAIASAAPAPAVGPEVETGPSVAVPDPFVVGDPHVACSSAGCVVVWTSQPPSGPRTLRIRRLDPATGSPVDPGGSSTLGQGRYPSVGCSGDACLVVWSVGEPYLFGLVAVKVDLSDGSMSDPAVALAGAPSVAESLGYLADVDCRAGACLVAWGESGVTAPLRAVRVDLASLALSKPIVLAAEYLASYPHVGCAGTEEAPTCLVSWLRDEGYPWATPRGTRFDLAGGGVLGAVIALADDEAAASYEGYAFDCAGDTCLAVWSGHPAVGALVAAVSLSTGAVLPVGGAPLAPVLPAPALGCTTGTCVLTWYDTIDSTHIALLPMADPELVETAQLPFQSDTSIACEGAACVLTTRHFQNAGGKIVSTLLASSVALDTGALTSSGIRFGTTASDQSWPAAACATPGCAAVWAEVRVTLGLGTLPVTGCPEPGGNDLAVPDDAIRPAAACADTGCVAAWLDPTAGNVRLGRLEASTGTVSGAALVAAAVGSVDLACNAASCILAWATLPTESGGGGGRVAAVDPVSASVTGPPHGVGPSFIPLPPKVACAATRCLAVWEDGTGVSAASLDPLTSAIGPSGQVFLSGPGKGSGADLACGTERCAVVYHEGAALRIGVLDPETAELKVLPENFPAILLPSGGGWVPGGDGPFTAPSTAPRIACTGGECLFVWPDAETAPAILGARLELGTSAISGPFDLLPAGLTDITPAVALDPGGEGLLIGARFDLAAGSRRVHLHALSLDEAQCGGALGDESGPAGAESPEDTAATTEPLPDGAGEPDAGGAGDVAPLAQVDSVPPVPPTQAGCGDCTSGRDRGLGGALAALAVVALLARRRRLAHPARPCGTPASAG